MVDFKQELRHRCRFLKCRSKLPAPVANDREAFCTRGCYSSFYLHRCRVCEKPIEQPKRGQRIICKKSKCKNAWNAKLGFGCYAASFDAGLISDKPVDAGVPTPVKAPRAGRGWRIIAGPELTPSQFHCATVPDGPNLGPDGLPTWEGGAWQRIEAKNRAALEAHFDKLDAEAVANDFCAICGRLEDLVDRSGPRSMGNDRASAEHGIIRASAMEVAKKQSMLVNKRPHRPLRVNRRVTRLRRPFLSRSFSSSLAGRDHSVVS